jgi:glyoxylase-like metal-dependent hydrolase (beta-lactamase superfamily II)
MNIKQFTFGPFQENTFILFDETKECVIVDPGCTSSSEQQELKNFIESEKLIVKNLLNTHCHVDHIAGNKFIYDTFGHKPLIHKDDLIILNNQETICKMYGLPCEVSPQPEGFISENDTIRFGNCELKIIHAPGHAPGHVVFYHVQSKSLINGDVLFKRSIGRTDLMLGNHEQLLQSIRTKLFVLPDETIVYCGHGPETTIGEEKRMNPFLN